MAEQQRAAKLQQEADAELQKQKDYQTEQKRTEQREQAKKHLTTFLEILSIADENGIVKSASVDGKKVTVTVNNLWHIKHKQIRLQDAQVLWETWAKIASPDTPDSARISIVDFNGNEVGGSRVLGGSLIWVQD